ncbi:MAG: hypothetical protein NVSMB2_23610 [Chloroflexota bacterium]
MFPSEPLDRVREGMEVFDASGAHLGSVARVAAAVPRTTHPPDSDLLDSVATVVPSPPDMTEVSNVEAVGASPFGHKPAGLPDLPDPVLEHLRTHGFIELNAPHLPDSHRFIPADRITEVTETQVTIRRDHPA